MCRFSGLGRSRVGLSIGRKRRLWFLAWDNFVGVVSVRQVLSVGLLTVTVAPATVHAFTMRRLLFAVRHNDPIVMLGMLQVVFCEHRISRCKCISRQ